jgi:hypothetical protein
MQLFIQLCSADSLFVFTAAVHLRVEAKDCDVVDEKVYFHCPQALIAFHSCDWKIRKCIQFSAEESRVYMSNLSEKITLNRLGIISVPLVDN